MEIEKVLFPTLAITIAITLWLEPETWPVMLLATIALVMGVWEWKWRAVLAWVSKKAYAKVVVFKYRRKHGS